MELAQYLFARRLQKFLMLGAVMFLAHNCYILEYWASLLLEQLAQIVLYMAYQLTSLIPME